MDATISQLATQLIAKVSNIIDPETALNVQDILYLSQSLESLSRLTEPTGTPASVPTQAPVQVDSTEGLVKIGSYQYQVQVFPDKVDFHRVVKGVEVLVETLNRKTGICSCKYGKRDCAHKKWLAVNPQVLEVVATVDEVEEIRRFSQEVTPTVAETTETETERINRISEILENDVHPGVAATWDEIYEYMANEDALIEVRKVEANTMTPEDDALISDEQLNDITETTPGVTVITQEVTPELMAEYLEDINGMPSTPTKTASITNMIVGEVQSGTHPVAGGLAGYLPGSIDDAIEVESVEVAETEPAETSDDENIHKTPTVTKNWGQVDKLKRATTLIGKNLIVTHFDIRLHCVVTQDLLYFTDETFGMIESFEWDSFSDVKQIIKSQLDILADEADEQFADEFPIVDTTKTHPDPVWDTDSDADGFPVVEWTHEGEGDENDEDYGEFTDEELEDYANWSPAPSFEQVVRTTLEGRVLRMGVPNPDEYSTQELAQIIKGDLFVTTDDEYILEELAGKSPQSDPTPLDVSEIELVPDLAPDADPFGDFDF